MNLRLPLIILVMVASCTATKPALNNHSAAVIQFLSRLNILLETYQGQTAITQIRSACNEIKTPDDFFVNEQGLDHAQIRITFEQITFDQRTRLFSQLSSLGCARIVEINN